MRPRQRLVRPRHEPAAAQARAQPYLCIAGACAVLSPDDVSIRGCPRALRAALVPDRAALVDAALAHAYAQYGEDVVMTRPVGVATDCALTQCVPTNAVTLK